MIVVSQAPMASRSAALRNAGSGRVISRSRGTFASVIAGNAVDMCRVAASQAARSPGSQVPRSRYSSPPNSRDSNASISCRLNTIALG